MPRVGEQADILRALGRSLDEQSIKGVQITNHETYLAVGWGQFELGTQLRAYQEHDLEELRAQARALRGGTAGGSSPLGSLSELLRTLGQELDAEQIEANGISQEADGFRVTGVAQGKYVSKLYPTSELLQLSSRRRAMRGSGTAAKAESREAQAFAQVTVGLRVFTQDGVELGTIDELAGSSFKVQDPSLLNFWLTAQAVAKVEPGAWVLLGFDRAHLDQYRSWAAPEPASQSASPSASLDPDEAIHDGVLWRDGGKTAQGDPIILGPLCPQDKATLLFLSSRGANPVPREVEPDHFIGRYTGSLLCPTCEQRYLLDEQGVKRVEVSRSEANFVLARARRRRGALAT